MKRFLDFSISIFALVILSPLLVLIGGLLFLTNCRPVIFAQNRIGKDGKIFQIYKFRTMREPIVGEDQHSLARLTYLGKILRGLSLDELPGLFNVLKGEMSLVGPRPLLVHYLGRYNERQKMRHHVRPGITGLAQINGRNSLKWEDKFNFDIHYVENQSLWFDLKILLKTFLVLFNRKTINSSQIETMEEFDPGLYVFGAGGHAKVVIATLQAADHKVMGIFDDDANKIGTSILGVPVIGTMADSPKFKVKKAVIAIGGQKARERIAKAYQFEWMTVIHPDALVHPSVKIGKGTVVFAKSIIQPDVTIGDHVIINSGVILEHDCVVGNYCHLCPGSKLAGNVSVNEGAMVGMGANIIPGKKIGAHSVIGAGSTVITDVKPYTVVAGSPAHLIKEYEQNSLREQA
jgi:perosamine synthetase